MKESFYFSHDFEPTNDPKICAMISVHGAAGYGLYWRIVEMLHSESTHFLKFKEYVYLAIAKQMATDAGYVQAFISDCINRFELFVSDGEVFYSERVMRNIETRNAQAERRSNAGRKAAMAKHAQANAQQTQKSAQQTGAYVCDNMPRKGKEIKGKERKVNKIKENENKLKSNGMPNGIEEVQFYFQSIGSTVDLANDFFDYYESVGWLIGKSKKPCRDWRAAVRTFLKNKETYQPAKENRATGLKTRPEAIFDTAMRAAESLKQQLKENGYTSLGAGAISEKSESGTED